MGLCSGLRVFATAGGASATAVAGARLLDACSLVARVLFSEESLNLEDKSVSGAKELAGTELSTNWVAMVSEDGNVSPPACGVT